MVNGSVKVNQWLNGLISLSLADNYINFITSAESKIKARLVMEDFRSQQFEAEEQ